MAVPKKKKAYIKSNQRYNAWKNNKQILQNFIVCKKCLYIKRTGFVCNNCLSF